MSSLQDAVQEASGYKPVKIAKRIPTPTKSESKEIEEQKPDDFLALLDSMKHEIAKALPTHLTPERMIRVARTAFSRNLKLKECDPYSVIAAVVEASQMGLELNTKLGHAYLIPRYNGKTKRMEAEFQIGYKGLLTLAYRTGKYKMIDAYKVYENDEFDYSYGLDQYLRHKPAKVSSGEPTDYYAVYKTLSGGEGFKVLSREKIQDHAKKHSQGYDESYSPWQKTFDKMAMKTMIIMVLDYAEKSIELQQQISSDGTVIDWEAMKSAKAEEAEPAVQIT